MDYVLLQVLYPYFDSVKILPLKPILSTINLISATDEHVWLSIWELKSVSPRSPSLLSCVLLALLFICESCHLFPDMPNKSPTPRNH